MGSAIPRGRAVQPSRAGLHWTMALLMLLAAWFYTQVHRPLLWCVPAC